MESNKIIHLMLLLLLIASKVHSQQFFTRESNMFRDGDRIYRTPIDISKKIEIGKNVIWDLKDLKVNGNVEEVKLVCDSIIHIIYPKKIVDLVQKEDSLFILREETPLQSDSIMSLLYLKYPIAYGDSIKNDFTMTGLYCNKLSHRTVGKQIFQVVGHGMLLLPNNDTIDNVLLVLDRREMLTSFNIHNDSINRYSEELLEKWQWYAAGYWYPVVEKINKKVFIEGEDEAEVSESYLCSLESIRDINKFPSIKNNENDDQEHPVIEYDVTIKGNMVVVDYVVHVSSDIDFIISDMYGIVHGRKHIENAFERTNQIMFECRFPSKGEYALHVNIDGKDYGKKIFK